MPAMMLDGAADDDSQHLDLYDTFAQALERAKDQDTLDSEIGLAPTFSALVESKIETADSDYFALESNTWDLIQALFSARSFPLDQPAWSSPFLTPLLLARQIIFSDRNLFDLLTVRDWLTAIPREFYPVEIRKGYLPFTTNVLKSALRSGKSVPRTCPTSLDPDAVLRAGRNLEPEDAAYDHALTKTLFEYVRMGRLDEALQLCRDSDQSWRAASLSGSLLWSDSAVEPTDQGAVQQQDPVQGNLNHRVWKSVCRKIASSPSVKQYEKALYGALSGDLNSVLPVCHTWEDQLWAHINYLLENHISTRLAASDAGQFFAKLALPAQLHEPTGADVNMDIAAALDALLRSSDPEVAQGARHPLRMAQSWIIQDKADQLLVRFVEEMRDVGSEDMSVDDRSNLIRFFAHLVLFLRELGIDNTQDEASQVILDAYVNVLQANDKKDLIAVYAGKLEPGLAVESYAQYLSNISPTATQEDRSHALHNARRHGIDYVAVALRTVRLIIAEALEEQPDLDHRQLFNSEWTLEEKQTQLIRSVEWLSFDRSTYLQLHLQSNALVRWFLSGGNTAAAQRLVASLPGDVDQAIAAMISVDEASQSLRNSLREASDYRLFFSCLQMHDRCLQILSRRPPAKTARFEMQGFLDAAKTATDAFWEITTNLLESEWLRFDIVVETGADAEKRLDELLQIRRLYIPELVFRLHQALCDTGSYISGNLQKALDLVNIVADESSRVYVDFVTDDGNRMPEYLDRVREASMAALSYSTNPFTVENWVPLA